MRRLILLGLLAASWACSSEPARPPSNVIWARFDPSTGDIPTPNDLVRDAKNDTLALPITPELAPADAEFRAYLNSLDGFPTATPALLHFSGDVKPATLNPGNVLIWQLDAHGGSPTIVDANATYADTDHGLTIYPPGGWARGTTYAIAIRGGTSGVAGANGEDVVCSPAFYFLRSGQDLTKHPWAMPGNTPQERASNAQQLETIREGLEPLIQKIVAQGWSRDDLAMLFTFTTSTHPEIQYDPLSQAIPLPNNLLLDPNTGLVSIPPDPNDTQANANVKLALDTLDGFSTTGPFAATATAPLDGSATDPGHMRLFKLANPPVEVLGATDSLYADNQHLFAQIQSKNAQNPTTSAPFTVLEPKTTYFWIITGMKGTDGSPVDAQPVGALLRLKSPLVANGKSQVSGIADADAARLEPVRAQLAPALDALESQGIARASLAAVVPFTTVDVEGHTRALLKVPYDQKLPLDAANVTVKTPDLTVFTNIAQIVEGELVTYDMLDPTTHAFATTGQPRRIKFTLTYPTGFGNGKKPKVVLFGHALATERRLSWFEANRLAQEGFAVFSFDLPYHGERSSCHATLPICSVINGLFATTNSNGTVSAGPTICTDPSNSDQQGVEPAFLCSSGVCGDDGTCVGGDFNRYSLYNSVFSGTITELGTPIASGSAFIDLNNLGATRDHFRQAEIDLSAGYRFLTQTDWTQILPAGLELDTSDVTYTGISLGGILGGIESGEEPHITTLALNVGGAGLTDLFQESATFGAILPPGLASQGITVNPPNLAGWQFLAAAHWLLDDVDPINIAHFAIQQPDDYVDVITGETQHWPQKRVLVQMAGADTIVPNPSTYRLQAVLSPGCVVCDPTDDNCAKDQTCVFSTFPLASHIFEADPLEALDGNAINGQNQVAKFLAGYP